MVALVVAVERIVDATTAARVRVDHGARPPEPAEVDGITRRIRALAEAVRSTTTPVRSEPEPTDDESSVLSPLHQELAAARAITDPGG